MPAMTSTRRHRIRGISSPVVTIGDVTLTSPFADLGFADEVVFAVVEEDAKTLMCLKDMKELGLKLNLPNGKFKKMVDYQFRKYSTSF